MSTYHLPLCSAIANGNRSRVGEGGFPTANSPVIKTSGDEVHVSIQRQQDVLRHHKVSAINECTAYSA